MNKKINLRIPGPTPLPPSVLEATAQQMISHRGPEFSQLQREITERLKDFFQTQNDIFLFTASGTGGLEASVVNLFSPGDKVLAISIGDFGDRFASIASTFGLNVIKLDFPWGQAAEAKVVQEALKRNREIKGVLITHNETSTGVTNDLASIKESVNSSVGDSGNSPLFVVDAISSLGGVDLPTDKLGCDVVITASQKAWMAPPGITMLSVSPRAMEATNNAGLPRCYWDFREMKKYADKWQTPFTPAVSVLYALHQSLLLMSNEGFRNIVARHQKIGEHTRQVAKALGLALFAEQSHASNTVTSIALPKNVDGNQVLKILHEKFGVILGDGQKHLAGKIVRVAHLGYVRESDIDEAMDALANVLAEYQPLVLAYTGT